MPFTTPTTPSAPIPTVVATQQRHRQWLTFGVFASVNLCIGITFSCIVPFFPAQARAKGLSTAEVGFIIGFYQLGQAIMAPLFGQSMSKLGPNRLFSSGLCLAASAIICFGWLPHMATVSGFFWSALCLRALMAIGFAAYKCSQTTILAQLFPTNLAAICGLLDTFGALSYSLGPILGSALTHFGGFSLPFAVFGLLMFLAGCLSIWLLSFRPSAASNQRAELITAHSAVFADGGTAMMRAVLALPEVWLTSLGVASLQICTFFYDASLADHVAGVDPSPMLTGTLISVTSITTMVVGPLCGFLIDRRPGALAEPAMLAGAAAGALFALLIGPSPLVGFFRLTLPVLFGAFAIQGMALSAMMTPSLRHCLRVAKDRGLDTNSAAICGCISGIIQGAVSLGAFLGNTLGGWSAQQIGFEWTATLAAACQLPFILGLVAYKMRQMIGGLFGEKDVLPLAESRRDSDETDCEENHVGPANYYPVSAI